MIKVIISTSILKPYLIFKITPQPNIPILIRIFHKIPSELEMCYQLLYQYNQPLEQLTVFKKSQNTWMFKSLSLLIENNCYYLKKNYNRIKLISVYIFAFNSKIVSSSQFPLSEMIGPFLLVNDDRLKQMTAKECKATSKEINFIKILLFKRIPFTFS